MASGDRELVITRVFDAPRAVVWKAWTDLDRARQWWGPKGFTLDALEVDPRPGGAWRAVMRSPDGKRFRQHGIFKEIVASERIAFTHIWDDEGPQSEMLVTVTFALVRVLTRCPAFEACGQGPSGPSAPARSKSCPDEKRAPA